MLLGLRRTAAAVVYGALAAALIACQARSATPISEARLPVITSTAVPTPTPANVSCADLDAAWSTDWPAAIQIVDRLIAAGQACGPEPLASKKYAAHFNYASALETRGQIEQAVDQYTAAFNLDPDRREAWESLQRLGRLPAPTPPACLPDDEVLTSAYSPSAPGSLDYITLQDGQLVVGDEPFRIRGVNYYPRLTPWHHFLTETDPTEMAAELDLISEAGFNTIRIFLWHDALFTCSPEGAIAVADTFTIVDAVLGLARERGLRVIVTLNDLPDLTYRPLYTDWARYDAQTAFIVHRYQDEPAILAWDLRNEGDLDYGARSPFEARFSQAQVVAWLAHVSQLVRENAPQHLVTAGWWGDPLVTEPYVDVLSFHHWYDAEQLQARIQDYQARTDKPLLLEEVGYHSWGQAPADARDEAAQAELLGSATAAAEAHNLAGWMVWTAFDFAPPSGLPPTAEYFFGLWRADLTPKPTLTVLPLP